MHVCICRLLIQTLLLPPSLTLNNVHIDTINLQEKGGEKPKIETRKFRKFTSHMASFNSLTSVLYYLISYASKMFYFSLSRFLFLSVSFSIVNYRTRLSIHILLWYIMNMIVSGGAPHFATSLPFFSLLHISRANATCIVTFANNIF